MKRLAIALTLVATLPLLAGEGKSGEAKHDHATAGEKHEKGKSCDMQAAEGTAVEMDGTMLCRKCDLKETEECEKVFQPAGETAKLVAICHGSKVDLEALSQHGGAKLHVKGKMVKCGETGKDELFIEEAKKI